MAIPRTNTELENYLVYGVDQKNRRIFFGFPIDWGADDTGDFCQASVEMAVRAIKRMEKDHPNKPIEIYMNSYGGDAYALLYFIDTIMSTQCQFKFYGGGAIMSAATWIMCVCDERYLYEDATIMLHDGWDWIVGKHTDVQISAEEGLRLQEVLTKIFVENSYMPKEFWDDVLQRDLFLTADETIKLGLADTIVKKPKRGNLRKKRQAKMNKIPHHSTMRSLVNKLYKRVKMNTPQKELKLHIPAPEKEDPNVIVDNTPIENDHGEKES